MPWKEFRNGGGFGMSLEMKDFGKSCLEMVFG
jgi:hypothetical protein